jgi:transposase
MPEGRRKTKLTPELEEKLLKFLRAGNYVETACRCVGLHKDTFYEWMKRGTKGEKPFAALVEAVDRAMAESEARDLHTIGVASQTQWTAAAWRLERRFPEKFGRRDSTKIDGKVDLSVGAKGALGSKLAKLFGEDTKPTKPDEIA